MRKTLSAILPIVDVLMLPFTYVAAIYLWLIRRAGVQRLKLCKMALLQVGVFPVRRHYYEPRFDFKDLDTPLDKPRNLPGIDWNADRQLSLLNEFSAESELADLPKSRVDDVTYYLENPNFKSGDAEFLYQLIRAKKPKRIVEVGSGHSTLIAIKATDKNQADDPGYSCEHTCIEPYEMLWLEKTKVKVLRERVEKIDQALFASLQPNDILFIDSSHMIRTQGDVLCEFLEILPIVPVGVIVHIHDIFSPLDYPKDWLEGEVRFWNEQYLLEAFLSMNPHWQIVGAVNYLKHNHYAELKRTCPHLTPEREPGSFYIQRIS
ncbi:MAG: class I SAM-dependent methyltransferase [Chlorobia bacterium]|nr:class I SAM-dependent methyltransferase [Fimbriimonadaceae bacterium]